jgi:hypothetical protein
MNPERSHYCELLWQTGGSQTDAASLPTEDVNWRARSFFCRRKKNGADAIRRFGDRTAAILIRRQKSGPQFRPDPPGNSDLRSNLRCGAFFLLRLSFAG